MKKILAILLAALLLIGVFAGCAKQEAKTPVQPEQSTPAETTPEAKTDEAPVEETPAEASPADRFENKELNIAIFEGGYGPDYWNEMVARFEAAYPGVKVNMQISPTIGDIIRPQIVSGEYPDFISMNDNDQTGVLLSLIKENALLELTDFFDEPGLDGGTPLKELVQDGILETSKCSPYGDGKIYLAPFNSSPMGLVYNKTLFAEKGWELPETWDDFFALGDLAKEEGIALFTYQGIYPGYIESVLWPAIGSAAGLDTLKDIQNYVEGSFSKPEVLEVLKNIQKISTDGYLMEGTVALNHTQSQTDMMMNKALFIPNRNWMENEMKDAPRADGFEFGLWHAPVLNKGDQPYVMTSVEQFSIPAAAKNPELAKEFLRFLYTEDSVKLFAEKSGGIYALKAATEWAKEYLTSGVYNMNAVYEHGKSMVFGFAALPEGTKVSVSDMVFNPLSDVMNGTMTPEQWAAGVEEAIAEVNAAR